MPRLSKHNCKKEPSFDQSFADIVLLANSFKETIIILADIYCIFHTLAKLRRSEFPR